MARRAPKSKRAREYEQYVAAYADALDVASAERARAEAAALAAAQIEALEEAASGNRLKLTPRGKPGLRTPDSEIVEIVRNLAQIQCTTVEAGLVFGVTGSEFRDWLRAHGIAREAWESGRGLGLISLRRAQFEAALAGNPTMLVWLGKQFLDQQDKVVHSGDSTQPIVVQWQMPTPNRE